MEMHINDGFLWGRVEYTQEKVDSLGRKCRRNGLSWEGLKGSQRKQKFLIKR